MSIWANATHVCTCDVDVTTGEVRILRYVVSEDCGPMINPNVVEGQIDGGAIQVAGVLLQLGFEARKKRKRVGSGPGETGADAV